MAGDGWVVSEEILGGDLIDIGVRKHREKRGAKAGNVVGVRGNEDVQILGCACEAMEVESDPTEYLVLHAMSMQRGQHTLGQLVVHASVEPTTPSIEGADRIPDVLELLLVELGMDR